MRELALRHVVITSVTRDDLPDGGAGHFAAVTAAVRAAAPMCRVELLVPDLGGQLTALATILAARPDVLGHNLETVPRLYATARGGADYRRSLALLAAVREIAPGIPTKSGLMLGLGEERNELLAVLADLHAAAVGMLTLGQYLQPTRTHLPVARYLPPEEFAELRQVALAMGFSRVAAGPLVRSSYHAAEHYEAPPHDRC